MSAPAPGTLVLLRHGESVYNAENRFTGLLDVDLSDRGVHEAELAGAQLAAACALDPSLVPHRILTSPLVRASATAAIVAAALPGPPPLVPEWRLVERHYGAFTDDLRESVRAEYGETAYWEYRRSFDHRPPPVEEGSGAAARVADTFGRLPDAARSGMRRDTESLADVVHRLEPLWEATREALDRGENLLVVGHGNSLRAFVMLVDRLTAPEVQVLNVPTGMPLVHRFTRQVPDDGAHPGGKSRLGAQPDAQAAGAHLVPVHRGGRYLDADRAEAALADLEQRGGT
ncbi:2,3-bisphosphoglycerate-dependent phosphoglycerate mutase [Oerskovia enterophila]|uniref:2,3-bisphosphoglycerate-dependent phosphoglycerate mutase n=1 Tax=Oerskovia enterophila TaxID=43678 RepID=A0A163R1T9_9CELL|nr:2,3-bisphosphoglycerate-dependent phosphoglycerate mutase [Oerskovia enterophila]KZM34763.1 2,3-bisphosphoglycerate-dependent phosphoglycerate mutase [Oerskovia enterophila]